MLQRPVSLLAFLALAALAFAADPLTAVFEHIDAAAKTFKGLSADISNTQHTGLTNTDDVQTGTVKLLRASANQTKILIDFKGPGAQTIAYDGHEGRVYNPKTKIVDIYEVGSRQSLANQYLLLGFGATSAALQSTYTVTWVGEEKVGSQPVSHLKLVPKSAETLRSLKQADLWFGANGLVVKQKFLTPDNDYKLVTYSNVKLGAPPEKELELKPKGATIQKQSLQ